MNINNNNLEKVDLTDLIINRNNFIKENWKYI
jgi:hypothetical protein